MGIHGVGSGNGAGKAQEAKDNQRGQGADAAGQSQEYDNPVGYGQTDVDGENGDTYTPSNADGADGADKADESDKADGADDADGADKADESDEADGADDADDADDETPSLEDLIEQLKKDREDYKNKAEDDTDSDKTDETTKAQGSSSSDGAGGSGGAGGAGGYGDNGDSGNAGLSEIMNNIIKGVITNELINVIRNLIHNNNNVDNELLDEIQNNPAIKEYLYKQQHPNVDKVNFEPTVEEMQALGIDPASIPENGSATIVTSKDGQTMVQIADENGNLVSGYVFGKENADGSRSCTIFNFDENGNVTSKTETNATKDENGNLKIDEENAKTTTYENGSEEGNKEWAQIQQEIEDGKGKSSTAAAQSASPDADTNSAKEEKPIQDPYVAELTTDEEGNKIGITSDGETISIEDLLNLYEKELALY